MKLTLLNPIWYGGKMNQVGEELELEETGEVRTWFALGWVKKSNLQTTVMTPETPVSVVDNPYPPPLEYEKSKSNIDPLTGKRRYRRRDMKAED